ncbi:DUF4145 domain-containing protein [Vibrio campbellii]
MKLEIKKLHCNCCERATNHELKYTHEYSDHEEDIHNGERVLCWWEETSFSLWVCRGCDTPCIEEAYTNSGMYDHQGETIHDYSYHPKRTYHHKKPQKFVYIDAKLNSLYKEIIQAYNLGLGVPTAVSIRSLLEGICIDQGITDDKFWKFEKKIEALQSESNIPESIIEGLKSIKFIGDDAAHRLSAPDKYVLQLAIDLLEALLTNLYEAKFELQQRAQQIKLVHQK